MAPSTPQVELKILFGDATLLPYVYRPEEGAQLAKNFGDRLPEKMKQCIATRAEYIIESEGKTSPTPAAKKSLKKFEQQLMQICCACKYLNRTYSWNEMEKLILPMENSQENAEAMQINEFLQRLKESAKPIAAQASSTV